LILGVANLVGDGISMGLSNFLGERSQRRFWQNHHRSANLDPTVWHSGVITFIAFNLAGILPLLPYILNFFGIITITNPFLTSIVATGIALLTVGSLRTLVTRGAWWVNGLEMLAVGSLAAAAAYLTGNLVERLIV
jgi:VIT1/CCC1 family predicted Fe2+/Mn2+ transporter